MENDVIGDIKSMVALNSSLSARLDDYAKIIGDRDREIEMLQAMLTEASAYRSTLDTQVDELKHLQENLKQLHNQMEGSSYIATNRQAGTNSSIEQQFESLKLQYTYLQTQLSDLQKQLLELNNRNLVLQQQTSRISELESLLDNASEEINELKSE